LSWINNFTCFLGLKHPRDMGQIDIETFLTFLAAQHKLSVSTHRQATITPVMVA